MSENIFLLTLIKIVPPRQTKAVPIPLDFQLTLLADIITKKQRLCSSTSWKCSYEVWKASPHVRVTLTQLNRYNTVKMFLLHRSLILSPEVNCPPCFIKASYNPIFSSARIIRMTAEQEEVATKHDASGFWRRRGVANWRWVALLGDFHAIFAYDCMACNWTNNNHSLETRGENEIIVLQFHELYYILQCCESRRISIFS